MVINRSKGYTLVELLTIAGITVTLAGLFGVGGYCAYRGVQALNKYINSPTVKVERANVIRGEQDEKFIEFNGERYYAEVDGKRVE